MNHPHLFQVECFPCVSLVVCFHNHCDIWTEKGNQLCKVFQFLIPCTFLDCFALQNMFFVCSNFYKILYMRKRPVWFLSFVLVRMQILTKNDVKLVQKINNFPPTQSHVKSSFDFCFFLKMGFFWSYQTAAWSDLAVSYNEAELFKQRSDWIKLLVSK